MRVAALLAQREALGDAEAVLFVDDGQPQSGEIDALLDQRVGADNQLRVGRRRRQLRPPGRALQAAREPGDADTERFQPVPELEVVLPGEDFGRCHEGRLPAGRNGLTGSERSNDGLAGTDVALQQALHRVRLGEVAADFGHRPQLGAGETERQAVEQARAEIVASHQHRRPLFAPCKVGAAQAQLLGQHLVELDALPGGMVARVQRVEIGPRWRAMQEMQAARETRQLEMLTQFVGEGVGQVALGQRLADQFLQRRIGDACGRRVNRGQFRR